MSVIEIIVAIAGGIAFGFLLSVAIAIGLYPVASWIASAIEDSKVSKRTNESSAREDAKRLHPSSSGKSPRHLHIVKDPDDAA